MGVISYGRYQYQKKISREAKLIPVIDELILKYMFETEDELSIGTDPFTIERTFKEKVGKLSKVNLQLITQRLIVCKNSFDFKTNTQLNKIIQALGIESFIEKKLDFSTRFSKMKGIQELAALSINASESKIISFTYSANNNIRREARSSYVRLSKNNPFKYFDESKDELNQWDYMNILQNISDINEDEIPNFGRWIAYSKNESIIELSIKMCSYFKQYESIPTLIDFLKNENHLLRAEAIKALGDLEAKECEDIFIKMYPNQPDNCQIEIVRSLGKLKTGNSLNFIQNEFNKSTSIDTKKVLAESLYNYGEQGRALFNSMLISEKGFSQLILKHIANPLIKFK